MKRNLFFVSFIILAILFTGCSFKDYNSAYKNEEGYSNYISNSKTGCKDMNSFGVVFIKTTVMTVKDLDSVLALK